MRSNNILTALQTLQQYNNCDITLTFKDQYNSPCLSVRYANRQFEISFLGDASVLTFEDVNSAYNAIERAIH